MKMTFLRLRAVTVLVLAAAMALGAALLGCSAGTKGTSALATNEETTRKVAELSERVDDLDSRLKKIEDLLRRAMEGPPEPDPTAVYSVPIDGYPAVGPADAKVTVVKAYEYACGYCYRARATIDELRAQYGDDLRVVYKPFIVHADVAIVPAMAACAADKQGKFEELDELIWVKGFAERDLGEDTILALAQEAGLDMDRLRKDMQGNDCRQLLQSSVENLSSVGVNGTPTFYINGRALTGAQPAAAFKTIIDEELEKARRAVAEGTPAASYYQKNVVEAGQKNL